MVFSMQWKTILLFKVRPYDWAFHINMELSTDSDVWNVKVIE